MLNLNMNKSGIHLKCFINVSEDWQPLQTSSRECHNFSFINVSPASRSEIVMSPATPVLQAYKSLSDVKKITDRREWNKFYSNLNPTLQVKKEGIVDAGFDF